jgi:uncharacterized protein YkwD
MKRIATILGIAAVVGVFPSVAAAGSTTTQLVTPQPARPALASAQIAKVQIAKTHIAKVQVANVESLTVARHNAHRARLSGLRALYPH